MCKRDENKEKRQKDRDRGLERESKGEISGGQ